MKIKAETELEWKASREMGLDFYYIKWRKKPHNWLQNIFFTWNYVYKYLPRVFTKDDPNDLTWFEVTADPEYVEKELSRFKSFKTWGELWEGFRKEQWRKHEDAVKAYNEYWSKVPSKKDLF